MSNRPASTETKEQLAKTVNWRNRRTNGATDDESIAKAAIIAIGDPSESFLDEPTAPAASVPAARPTSKSDPARDDASTVRITPATGTTSTVRIAPVQQARTEFRDLRTTGTLRIRAPLEAATAREAAAASETAPPSPLDPQAHSRGGEVVEPMATSGANDSDVLGLGETIVRAVPLSVLLGGSNPPQRAAHVTHPPSRAPVSSDRTSSDKARFENRLTTGTLVMPIKASAIAEALGSNRVQTNAAQTNAAQTNAAQTNAAQTSTTAAELARTGATLGRIETVVPWGAETLVKPVAAPTMTKVLAHVNALAKATPVANGSGLPPAAGPGNPLRAETIVNPVASPVTASPASDEPESAVGGQDVPGSATATPLGQKRKADGAAPKPAASGIRKVIAAMVVVAVGVAGAYVAMPTPAPQRGTPPRASSSSSASTAQNTDGKPMDHARAPQSRPNAATAESGNKAISATVGGKTLERQAVDAIARGAYAEAANLYERMDQDPEAPFHEAARIARRKAQSER